MMTVIERLTLSVCAACVPAWIAMLVFGVVTFVMLSAGAREKR